jgi:hypothetical protein
MEEPQRSQVLKAYEAHCKQWEETIDRTRENLAAGAAVEDLIGAEGATLLAVEGWTRENLAFLVGAMMVREASMTRRQAGARKKAVPAKLPRKVAVASSDRKPLDEAYVLEKLGIGDDGAAVGS